VVAPGDHGDPAEPTLVVERQGGAVVELPRCPAPPGVGHGGRALDREDAGHAEVDDQLPVVVGGQEQVLATSKHGQDAGTDHLGCVGELRRRVGARRHDATAREAGVELAPDGLDLGQFGHRRTVAAPWVRRSAPMVAVR